ncbi:MAG: CDP-glycerol glycerophosphotransferase family protein [Firmicutes bacterium]|nr:CDP-glycerol glycerophosphotransferase family protein [Bacillota bacterium]
MKELLRKLKHSLKSIQGNNRLKRIAKKHSAGETIKVGFIAQMPEVWDKVSRLYEAMCDDADFEPWLLLVPQYDLEHGRLNMCYGEERAFFVNQYKDGNILEMVENNTVKSIENSGLDYIFYQRCYDGYLPDALHASKVIRYCKTCYIPYCYHAIMDGKEYYRTEFFSNLYLFFCSNQDQVEWSKTASRRKTVYLGYPWLDKIGLYTGEIRNRILWTPRWCDDPATGGTTFFKYKDRFFDLVTKNDVKVTIRPHPLTFQNAVREGKMSDEDVAMYKDRLAQAGIELDQNALIEKTFENTDVLITDFSSIIINFFLSGKPIIYCGDTGIDFSETYQSIIDSSYIAHSWEEIETAIQDILAGNDYLKEKRLHAIERIKGQGNAVENILNYLKNDSKHSEP